MYKMNADLQSHADGETRLSAALTLPTHGGRQRVRNFMERYGAPWEHTHPHGNMSAESRKTNTRRQIQASC